jgi:hypothetical protein
MGKWTGAEEAGALEREAIGGKGPEALGPVGIEGEPRPGGAVAVATLGMGWDRLSGGGLAGSAPVGHTDAEGISALRGQSRYQGRSVVGRIAARGAAAAWPWIPPLGCRGKWDRRGTVTCQRTGGLAGGERAGVDACGAVPC